MTSTANRRSRFQTGEVRVVEEGLAHTVPCFRLPEVPGAALHRMVSGHGWALAHERTGLAIQALLPTERMARKLMRCLAGHNFDRDREEVIRDEQLSADLFGYASQVRGEHRWVHQPDGTWTPALGAPSNSQKSVSAPQQSE